MRWPLRLFWAGPGRHDILLWLWPEGFFRHSLGGKLRLLTDHLKQDFFQQLEAWQNAVPTVGILHNWMPRHRKGNAGRHWIDLYQTLVQKSHGVIHLGDVSLEQWGARFDFGERQPLTLKVSHGLNEQLKAYQEHHNIEALQPSRRPKFFVPGDLRTDNEVTMVLKTVEAMSSEAVDWVIVGGDTYGRRGQKNFFGV